MPFCSKCGAAVDGRFCPQCGGEVASAGAAGAPGSGPSAAPTSLPVAGAGLTDNVAGALCYALLLITGILFLVLAPYNQNKTIRFHAFQAILLNVAWIVVWFGFGILLSVVHFGFFFSPLLWLAFLALWLYMIVSTYQGKTVVLPVIGAMAQQQA